MRLRLAAAPAKTDGTAGAATAPRPVIEDNLDAAESLQLALEMEGHEVSRGARRSEGER